MSKKPENKVTKDNKIDEKPLPNIKKENEKNRLDTSVGKSNEQSDKIIKEQLEHEEKMKKKLYEKLEVLRNKNIQIDKNLVFKMEVSYYFESTSELKKIESITNELFFDFKLRLFNQLKANSNEYSIFLANRILINCDFKNMSEIFEHDRFPIISIRKNFKVEGKKIDKTWTKVSIENYSTPQDVFAVFNKWFDHKKTKIIYHQEVINNSVIFSFEKTENAYSLLKTFNKEKILNPIFCKIKTSLFTESYIKPNFKKSKKNTTIEINLNHHENNYNERTGTYKNNLNREINTRVNFFIRNYFIIVSLLLSLMQEKEKKLLI